MWRFELKFFTSYFDILLKIVEPGNGGGRDKGLDQGHRQPRGPAASRGTGKVVDRQSGL